MATLNVKAGPMLRYDSVDIKTYVYHAYALLITADEGSDYSSPPSMSLRYNTSPQNGAPAPADGNGVSAAAAAGDHQAEAGPSSRTLRASKLHQYHGPDGSYTFWRFKIEVPMRSFQVSVTYSIDAAAGPKSDSPTALDAPEWTFYVPSRTQNFRWAGHSCNGFSASIDESEWNGANPLWDDLMKHHAQSPFHAVVGGGDQIYCDKLTQEPEMQPWVHASDPKTRMAMELTPEIRTCIDRYYFHHYCEWFGSGTFSQAIAQIPMVNMLDDHDLIDGFGTYPDTLMKAPVFNHIGSRGYFWYLLFQLFINDEVDGKALDKPHPNKSMIIGGDGTFIPFPNHSLLVYMGPKQWLLAIDCRAERKVDLICGELSYKRIFDRLRQLPSGVEHLVVLLGVPLAYPRMVFLERTLSSSFNPLIMLAKGLSPGFTNKFNGQVELLDDLGDHWCAGPHKHERNWLVERVQEVALQRHVRVSFISGDVHAAGVGVFFGYHQHDPSLDPKYMLAVITSAIVNAPPPPAVITMLNKLARKKHRSLFYVGTKESMVPLFDEDVDGHKLNDKYIMGRRNWCAVTLDESTSELEFDIRIEKDKGAGETKSYPVRAPAPRWQIAEEHHHLLHHKHFEKQLAAIKEGKDKAIHSEKK